MSPRLTRKAGKAWWHRLPACAPHRQDAGATKKFSGQKIESLKNGAPPTMAVK
jgi:hypothetical protein